MSQVWQKKGDPRIYLLSRDGEWIYYDPNHECLGSGAMGTIYLGFGTKSGKRVAIKRVKDQFAYNPVIRERARLEASLVFNHPNVVQMLGYCECSPNSGPIFILSEYVSGVTLEHLAKTQLSYFDKEEKARRIVSEICHALDGLACIHSYGIVHRDIKPSNIMIEGGKTCKLMDLGIARMNRGNKFSTTGFIGTPQYSAPEQIQRDSDDDTIDGRADIYAMGVTLYEVLTGVNPFDAETQADIIINQTKKRLPYNNNIPRRLFHIISKATEKNPDKRYQTAIEFKEALTDYINSPIKNKGIYSLPNTLRITGMITVMIAVLTIIGISLSNFI